MIRSKERVQGISKQLKRRTFWFFFYFVGCMLFFLGALHDLLRLSLSSDTVSHIPMIPFIALGLMWINRKAIFKDIGSDTTSRMCAAGLVIGSILMFSLSKRLGAALSKDDCLGLVILSMLFAVWAGFAMSYGTRAFRAAAFPLLFLLTMVPVPRLFLDPFILWLQLGSAEVTSWIFHLTGTPVLRDGMVFSLPGVTIEIAKECSGIRSTLALLITCSLAGYLFLQRWWSRMAFSTAALPILVVKNGIRITTLTLLALHVDRGFLFGSLHQKGGIVFFAIALIILMPVLRWLQRSERNTSTARTMPYRESQTVLVDPAGN
jgi:exosortase